MAVKGKSRVELEREVEELRARLDEAQETLRAIREGDLDALVISTVQGEKIFTLEGADQAYRTIVEQMQEGAVTIAQDGSIRYCNRHFAEMLSLPGERVVGSPFRDYVVTADREHFDQLMARARKGRARGELWLGTGSAPNVPVYLGLSSVVVNGVSSICVVVTDLTERKRTEQVLASEQFVRRLIENAPIGVAVVDRNLRYILANPAYRAIAGDAPLVGRTIAETFPPSVAQIVQPYVQQVLESGQPLEMQDYEAPIRGQSWWNVSEIPLHDAAGNTEAVLILTQEVTERRRAEEDLKAAKVSAEQAKAVAEEASRAKDQFLAVLSHELRTPLTPVLTAAQMLEADPQLPPELLEFVAMIRRNAELETRLIDDLLDLTRISRGKLEMHFVPTNAHRKIEHVIEICQQELREKQQELVVQLEAGRHCVQADAARLQQVVWNLLKNAIKFTPVGGRILIRTSNADKRRLSIEVIDTGIGIEPQVLPRLFSAFEQGGRDMTRQFGGLGLGLAISKALTEMHGGDLSVHSEGRGRGARFTVSLPISAQSEEISPSTTLPAPGSKKAGRILLVEDHADTRKVMEQLLDSCGHQVQTADSVASALEAAQGERFDLLISDIGLPDGTGLELMRQLSQMYPLKGIALSGYGMEEDLRKSREAGFLEHLVKPLNIAQFESTIERLLGCGDGGANCE